MTTKYICTIEDIAKIVGNCVRQTVAGSSCNKNWKHNVENSIEGINKTSYLFDKVKLEKLK